MSENKTTDEMYETLDREFGAGNWIADPETTFGNEWHDGELERLGLHTQYEHIGVYEFGGMEFDIWVRKVEVEVEVKTFTFRDPFAGWVEAVGTTIEDAVESCYADIPFQERPKYVWYYGEGEERIKVPVPGGQCTPLQ